MTRASPPIRQLPYGTGALATFFVLSGFVPTWGEPWRSTVARFWRRRVVKIYPGHVIVWAATLLMLFAMGPMSMIGSWEQTKAGPAVANLFLVQDWIPQVPYVFSVYGVNWSVSVEILFYLSLPLLIRPILRIADKRLWAWFAVCAVVIVAIPTFTHFFLDGPLAPGMNMSWYRTAFPDADIVYAAKAFLCRTMAHRVQEEGLGLDVCSAGELALAVTTGFPPEKIVMHGNAKSPEDLRTALRPPPKVPLGGGCSAHATCARSR